MKPIGATRPILIGATRLIFLFALSHPAFAQQTDGSGLQFSAAVDITGQYATDEESTASDTFGVREAEFSLFAPIDPVFDGILGFAAHQEEGVSVAEVHEAYISSSKLIPRSRFKIGQFFLGVGRLNQFHRHDWPFISAPLVHKAFFGEEGVFDSGIEYSVLLPTPFFLDLTIGATNGYVYGHAHGAGEKPKTPTHYARIATYFDGPGALQTQTGLNYLSRTDAAKTQMTLLGWDWTSKIKTGKVLTFLLQGELWQREMKPEATAAERTVGFYFYPQYGFNENWLVGIRADYMTIPTLKDVGGAKIKNSESGFVPTITYKPSEFSTFRLAYETISREQTGMKTQKNQLVELQTTFILGAHPAHDF